jgi:hypothetical protein
MRRINQKKLKGFGITYEAIYKRIGGGMKYQLIKKVNHKRRLIKFARRLGISIDVAIKLYAEKEGSKNSNKKFFKQIKHKS